MEPQMTFEHDDSGVEHMVNRKDPLQKNKSERMTL